MNIKRLKEKLISILSEAHDINNVYVLTAEGERNVIDFEVDSVGDLRIIVGPPT